GGAEVPAGEAGEASSSSYRAGAVVHVDRQLVEILPVGHHHAALARRDDLVELEAESAGVAERAESLASERRAGRLANVLAEDEAVFSGDRAECAHVRGSAAHVDGQKCTGRWTELSPDVLRIEGQRVVDLGQDGKRSCCKDGVRSRVPGVRGDDHLVARTDP